MQKSLSNVATSQMSLETIICRAHLSRLLFVRVSVTSRELFMRGIPYPDRFRKCSCVTELPTLSRGGYNVYPRALTGGTLRAAYMRRSNEYIYIYVIQHTSWMTRGAHKHSKCPPHLITWTPRFYDTSVALPRLFSIWAGSMLNWSRWVFVEDKFKF